MLKVMSLNIRFGLAEDGVNNWQHRKKAFAGLLDDHPADFICLQEVNNFQLDHIRRLLPQHHFIGMRDPAPDFWQNNIILHSKSWRCTHSAHFFLSPTPDIPSRSRTSRWPRQCTMGLFERGHQQLICINTHFDFAPDVRVQSAHIIMKRLTSLPPDIPALFMGDFNASPDCPCYRVITRAQAGHRCPVFRNAAPQPYAGTYHGFSGISDGRAIDWILYRGNLSVTQFDIIQKAFSGFFPSDHFPLFAQFEWPPTLPKKDEENLTKRYGL